MQVISVDLKNFSSVLYSEASNKAKEGYNPVGLSDFDEDEQEKILEILSVFGNTDEMDLNDIATIRSKKGTIDGLFAGTVWQNKDKQLVLTFGSNEFPLEIKEVEGKKRFVFGDAVVNYDPKGVTRRIDDKDIKVPSLTVESNELEDEENEIPTWEMEISFFFDSDKIKPSQQLAAINNLLKTGDIEKFADLVKVKGSGKGYPVKLVDVTRIFYESKTEIPSGGLQFQVTGFDIQPPPETNPEYGYSLILDIAEPVPFPVLYKERKDKKETGRVLPYQSPVSRFTLSKASSPTKSLINQSTGEFFNTATTKKLFEWAENGNLILSITALNDKEPDRRIPDCQLKPGGISNDNVQMFAEKTKRVNQNLLAAQNAPANGAVPFPNDEILEAAVVSGDEDF